MSSLFFRLHADQTQTPVSLENQYAGPTATACWLIGGGPSLASLPCEQIARSPVPKMTINLAGTRLLRPTFWTSYDPTVRFHRSIYLDASVMKFVHRRRAMDLVPETNCKVCECPNLYFFDRDGERGFADFVSPQGRNIVDWADSMVQAIDILYRLGFRVIYLAGCEMRVRPSLAQRMRAAKAGVNWNPDELLQDFVRRCVEAGISAQELDGLGTAPQYHFDEFKPIQAAANTDLHYFRVAQYLRLSRRSLALAGLKLISVTPHSRLNGIFPYVPARRVLRDLRRAVGDPDTEPVRGLYRQTERRRGKRVVPMRDYRPHNWASRDAPPTPLPNERRLAGEDRDLLVENEGLIADVAPARRRLDGFEAKLDQVAQAMPNVREVG